MATEFQRKVSWPTATATDTLLGCDADVVLLSLADILESARVAVFAVTTGNKWLYATPSLLMQHMELMVVGSEAKLAVPREIFTPRIPRRLPGTLRGCLNKKHIASRAPLPPMWEPWLLIGPRANACAGVDWGAFEAMIGSNALPEQVCNSFMAEHCVRIYAMAIGGVTVPGAAVAAHSRSIARDALTYTGMRTETVEGLDMFMFCCGLLHTVNALVARVHMCTSKDDFKYVYDRVASLRKAHQAYVENMLMVNADRVDLQAVSRLLRGGVVSPGDTDFGETIGTASMLSRARGRSLFTMDGILAATALDGVRLCRGKACVFPHDALLCFAAASAAVYDPTHWRTQPADVKAIRLMAPFTDTVDTILRKFVTHKTFDDPAGVQAGVDYTHEPLHPSLPPCVRNLHSRWRRLGQQKLPPSKQELKKAHLNYTQRAAMGRLWRQLGVRPMELFEPYWRRYYTSKGGSKCEAEVNGLRFLWEQEIAHRAPGCNKMRELKLCPVGDIEDTQAGCVALHSRYMPLAHEAVSAYRAAYTEGSGPHPHTPAAHALSVVLHIRNRGRPSTPAPQQTACVL